MFSNILWISCCNIAPSHLNSLTQSGPLMVWFYCKKFCIKSPKKSDKDSIGPIIQRTRTGISNNHTTQGGRNLFTLLGQAFQSHNRFVFAPQVLSWQWNVHQSPTHRHFRLYCQPQEPIRASQTSRDKITILTARSVEVERIRNWIQLHDWSKPPVPSRQPVGALVAAMQPYFSSKTLEPDSILFVQQPAATLQRISGVQSSAWAQRLLSSALLSSLAARLLRPVLIWPSYLTF